jgi:Protein of unknown function (DUF2946)
MQGCSLQNISSVKKEIGVVYRIEMIGKRKTTHDLARVLALTLAVLFVVFYLQALSHSHANGQDEATCQLCQAAHIGPAQACVAPSLVTPLLTAGYVQPFVLAVHQELFFHDSPSRAPPSA